MYRNKLGQFARSFLARAVSAANRFVNRLYHRLAYAFFAFVFVSWGVGIVAQHINQIVQDALLLMAPVEYVAAVGTTTPEEPEEDPVPPILQKIAKCESRKGHYENGFVILRGNNDRSVDIGKYQINSIHIPDAVALGLDLTKEEDNETFALWLYEHKGTEPWYSSKHCWK